VCLCACACACVGFARDDELASSLATATARMPVRVRVRACVHMDVSMYLCRYACVQVCVHVCTCRNLISTYLSFEGVVLRADSTLRLRLNVRGFTLLRICNTPRAQLNPAQARCRLQLSGFGHTIARKRVNRL
jgi:hypothetical protein